MTAISRIRVATIRHLLKVPINYGYWVMNHREFVLVRVDTTDGVTGVAYGLTRDGPVASIVERSIRPHYLDRPVTAPEESFYRSLWANHAVHAAGIGHRALSLVDLATWDAKARLEGVSITRLLGGSPVALPATAIVGYPPDTSPEQLADQMTGLAEVGWRRFKIPISSDLELSERRLRAARAAMPDAWIGFDINMVLRTPESVIDFEERVRDLNLGWIEDIVPPGDAQAVATARRGSRTPIAMGDEQGGSYHPAALLSAQAVDVIRADATTNGGVTRLPAFLEAAKRAAVPVAPHMFPHLHSRLMSGFGQLGAPIEWGIPGTGVHPMDDGLEQPVINEGMMNPLDDAPGFGRLIDRRWIAEQIVDDPESALHDLPEDLVVS
jgi:L-alanine-DL-glutamate epimerase-like enolase superfamily enzyme